ncbi:MAG: acetyltransferase [Bacteroidia bacterium]|nr:acetyltransferase [Bacteroidia bacterium]
MNIVIAGANPKGQAKVVLEIVEAEKKYTVVGFIDDDPTKKGLKIRELEVLGGMKDLPELIPRLNIGGGIVAFAHNQFRREVGQKIKSLGLQLINTIHPTAHIDSDVRMGEGVVVSPGAIIVTGSKIGNSVNILTGATIDHDNEIEDGVVISPGVHTSGRVIIRRDVFVGTGAIFLPDAEVGEGAFVGAGAVVLKNVPAGEVWAGVPAKPINKR